MSFTALMVSCGYEAKIWQSGIHTYSVGWGEFKKSDGASKVLAANVDNTFKSITWQLVPETMRLTQWLKDIGIGAQVDWYNQNARSQWQIEALRNMPVGDSAKARLRRLVHTAISCDE